LKSSIRHLLSLGQGDVARGKVLLDDTQKFACAKCHSIDGSASKAGSDLLSVGDQFGRRDSVDAVPLPSATNSPGHETVVVQTKPGVEIQVVLEQSNQDGRNDAMPSGNPLVERVHARPGIWSCGFRDPCCFRFDRLTSNLWLADAGQDCVEEVDIAHRGENDGWNVDEGFEPLSNHYRIEGRESIIRWKNGLIDLASPHHHVFKRKRVATAREPFPDRFGFGRGGLRDRFCDDGCEPSGATRALVVVETGCQAGGAGG
jgi:hypothetical protein